MIRSTLRSTLLLGAATMIAVLSACADVTSPTATAAGPAFAKGGGGGGATVPVCATVAITNNAQTVKNLSMPEIRYNLESCGSSALNVTVTVTEFSSAWSVLCPSPVAAPVQMTLAAGQKISSTFPVYRGPCGFTGPVNGTLVQGVNRWQGHNLMVTVTDDADGTVLSQSMFSWQDAIPRV